MRTRIRYVKDGKQHVANYPMSMIDLYPWQRALEKCEIDEFTVDLIDDYHGNE